MKDETLDEQSDRFERWTETMLGKNTLDEISEAIGNAGRAKGLMRRIFGVGAGWEHPDFQAKLESTRQQAY
jgi:hypothetical protein